MKENLTKEIALVAGVIATVDGSVLTVKGPKGEVKRNFLHPQVKLSLKDGKIILAASKATKREKTVMGSFAAHILNMVKGVQHPHIYKLKICSGHFPMNVSVSGRDVTVKNFLGEAVPRKIKVTEGAVVKVNGDEIEVSSADKEVAGQAAAQIETLCKVTNRDRRIFQDGCYITHKSGKDI